jgi:hypothetical protein
MSTIRASRVFKLISSAVLALSFCLGVTLAPAQEMKAYDCTVSYTPKGRPAARGVSKLPQVAPTAQEAADILKARFEENGNTNVSATCTDTPTSPFLR